MLSQNNNALGIIFPNSYDTTVPELVTERAMASIPFAGRYRMVDFVLSSMANCGISNVSIVVRKNYHSLMDHLGTGREWDMARRHGGLNIVPPFAEKGVRIYSGRVEALGSILNFLENQKEKYVVMVLLQMQHILLILMEKAFQHTFGFFQLVSDPLWNLLF